MIVTYPNYLEQSQVIGLNAVSNYHSVCVDVATPYPLLISVAKSVEYGIAISGATEYGITISYSGGGS